MKSLLHILPNEIKIAGHIVAIKFVDKLENNDYGYFSNPELSIVIAKSVECNDKTIELNEAQLINTFFHELKVWAPYIVIYM